MSSASAAVKGTAAAMVGYRRSHGLTGSSDEARQTPRLQLWKIKSRTGTEPFGKTLRKVWPKSDMAALSKQWWC